MIDWAGFGAAFRALVEVVQNMVDTVSAFFDNERRVTRYAIERLDVPESDIRAVEGNTVILWNRRTITLPEGWRDDGHLAQRGQVLSDVLQSPRGRRSAGGR